MRGKQIYFPQRSLHEAFTLQRLFHTQTVSPYVIPTESDLAVSIHIQYNLKTFTLVLSHIDSSVECSEHFQTDVIIYFLGIASSVYLHRTAIATENEVQSMKKQFVFIVGIW